MCYTLHEVRGPRAEAGSHLHSRWSQVICIQVTQQVPLSTDPPHWLYCLFLSWYIRTQILYVSMEYHVLFCYMDPNCVMLMLG